MNFYEFWSLYSQLSKANITTFPTLSFIIKKISYNSLQGCRDKPNFVMFNDSDNLCSPI